MAAIMGVGDDNDEDEDVAGKDPVEGEGVKGEVGEKNEEGEGIEGGEAGTGVAGSTDAEHKGKGKRGEDDGEEQGGAVLWLELDDQGITDEGLVAMDLPTKYPVSQPTEYYCSE